jgi:glycosyltransferase involved in cell wall biosynthesis
MPEPFFSVVIPTCNRPQILHRCLTRLKEQTLPKEIPFEILVGDDSHDDETRIFLEAHHPETRWIRGAKKGPAANRNRAAQQAHGQWIIFIDDDTEPHPDFLRAYHGMFSGGQYQALEGKIVCPDKLNSPFYRMPENLHGGLFTSGNLAFEKNAFFELGAFDEDLVVMEDLEIAYRVKAKGYKHTFCEGAAVDHRAQRFGWNHLLWWAFHHRWTILYDYKIGAKSLSLSIPAASLKTTIKHLVLLLRTTWHLFSQHDPKTWKNRWFWQLWGWVSLPLTLPSLWIAELQFRKLMQEEVRQ